MDAEGLWECSRIRQESHWSSNFYVSWFSQDTDRDFFMGAQEAVDYGLIDGVISRPQLIAATNGATL